MPINSGLLEVLTSLPKIVLLLEVKDFLRDANMVKGEGETMLFCPVARPKTVP